MIDIVSHYLIAKIPQVNGDERRIYSLNPIVAADWRERIRQDPAMIEAIPINTDDTFVVTDERVLSEPAEEDY